MNTADPFRHHPHLRDKIRPASESFFRDMNMDEIDARAAEAGFSADWRTPCDEREANRREFMIGHGDGDLWVFGYGSLMWDPALEFDEVRVARSEGYQRSFCLWDEGGRGSFAAPGLMLALDGGGACDGVAFRIHRDRIDHETFVLFRREMIGAAYRPAWLSLDTAQGAVTALTFVANHGHERIRPDIPLAEQARMIAIAEGMLGTNFDYLSDTHSHLETMNIHDGYVSELFGAVRQLRAEG